MLRSMKTQVSCEQAEAVRKRLGVSPEALSVSLGYSPTAYREAIKRGKLSRWMAGEIRRRYWRHLDETCNHGE